MNRFETVGIIRNQPEFDESKLDEFMNGIEVLRNQQAWSKEDILKLYLFFYQSLHTKRLANT